MICGGVLVVEDDPDIRDAIRQILELEGYKVFTTSNGKEAIDLLRKIESPCLILLDLMMPIMNGWEFLEVQRGNHILADIPVVIATAGTDIKNLPKTAGFMRKPVDLDALLSRVRQFCGEMVHGEVAHSQSHAA